MQGKQLTIGLSQRGLLLTLLKLPVALGKKTPLEQKIHLIPARMKILY